jgi:opacity protein-like surface antigen
MKKFFLGAAAAALLSTPAFAETVTLEFAAEGEDAVVLLLDPAANTVTYNGDTSAASWDAATNTLCSQTPDGEICATMADVPETPTVGHTTTFTTNDGKSGTVTVVSVD